MRIKLLVGCAGATYAFQKGGEYDTTDEIGKDLVRAGFAIELTPQKVENASAKPKDKAKAKTSEDRK